MFYAPKGLARPIRLCDRTRTFAYESLNHKYGLDTKSVPAVTLDHIDAEVYEKMSPTEKYDAAIAEIAAKAPLRICDGECISGAATLGLAISHRVPATYNGNAVFESISHLTIDFETVLKYGIDHIRKTASPCRRGHALRRRYIMRTS